MPRQRAMLLPPAPDASAPQTREGMPVAVRHIESIIRRSEAHAAMHLREQVIDVDVDAAISVMIKSFVATQKFGVQKQLQKARHRAARCAPRAGTRPTACAPRAACRRRSSGRCGWRSWSSCWRKAPGCVHARPCCLARCTAIMR